MSNRGDYTEQWSHHSVGYLIISTKDFIVHVDKEGHLDWETTPQYDSITAQMSSYNLQQRNIVFNEAALLEVSPCEGFAPETRLHFKRLIGETLVCSLEHDYSGAKGMLEAARQFIRARGEETSRNWYLSATFVSCAPAAAIGTLVWLFRDYLAALLGRDAVWIVLAMVAGSLGALLSVITRAGRLKFDCSAGRRLHTLEAWSRIGAGAISGLLVALAVRAGIILSALTQSHQLHPLMILSALTAGAGERFAPSIITKFDTAHVHFNPDSVGEPQGGERPK